MKIQLSKLKGANECLPKKKTLESLDVIENREEKLYKNGLINGCNESIDDHANLVVSLDEEALAQLIAKERYASIEFGREYAKFICAHPELVIKIERME